MSVEQELLSIEDMAVLFGRSKAAIKFALHVKAKWLPPSFMQGRRRVWLLSTVRKYLEKQEELINTPPRKRGRPRKTPIDN